MANPTREQIEDTFAKPTYKVEVLSHSGTWYTVSNARIVSISGSTESTSNSDNGLAFGTPSDPSATVNMEDYLVDGTRYMNNPYWINKAVRISFGFDTSDFVTVYQGPIQSINKSNEDITWNLGSSLAYLKDIKIDTPIYYRKPVATKTTIASQENPDGIGYVAGLINLALWRAGGRPYEQKTIVYTEASTDWKFWYSCEQSIIAPDYAWFSSENTEDEVYTLCRAAGGQLYQDTLGVIRYVQPLSFADLTSYSSFYTFTDSVFNGYEEDISVVETVGTLKLQYTPRRINPMQDVYEDTTPRQILPFAVSTETLTLELVPSLPVYVYQGLVDNDDITAINTMKAQLLDNRAVTPTIGTVEQYASKVRITLSNPDTTTPMMLTSVKLQGRPLAAGDDINIQYPIPALAVLPERVIESNVYIQNEVHAQRLLQLIYDFYNELRPIITLNNVQYDPDRFIGEIVQLDCTYNSNPAYYFRIIGIDHDQTGITMNIKLIQITNLPNRGEMFIIGTVYSSGTTKKLSY